MIITTAQSPVSRVGEMEEVTFSIKATSKALKILTSNMYSNPVRACLQELSANALDANLMAGNADKPISVTLPNTFHPQLVVLDQGTGMSHEFMMRHYTKVFESTKDKDNVQQGSYGAGRLSALALADAYSVICWDGVERREYSIFFNERGIPAITLLVEQPDTHAQGVEVRVPIARSLHSQFQDEARDHVYRFYKVKPTIKGGSGWPGFSVVEFNMSGNGWSFFKDSYQVSTAVMGVYHFPIQADSINKLNDEQRALIESGIVLHVPLGDMDVSSNRESIYFSEKTNTTLKKMLDQAQADLSTHIQAEFDKCANLVEAKRLYFKYFRIGGIANKIGRILGEKPVVSFNGEKVKDCELELTDGAKAHSFIKTYRRGKDTVKKSDYDTDIMLQPAVALYEADSRFSARVKYAHGNRVGADDCSINNISIVLSFKDAAARTLFYKTNGLESTYQFDLTSALPKPPRETGNWEKTPLIYTFNMTSTKDYAYRDDAKQCWDAEMVEDDDDDVDDVPAGFDDIDDENPVYITFERYLPCGFRRDVGALRQLLLNLKKLGFKGPLYGIRPSAVADAKAAGWTTFAEAVRPLFDVYFKDNQASESISLTDYQSFINHKLTHLIPGLDEAIKKAKTIEEDNSFIVEMENAARLAAVGYKLPARLKHDVNKDLKAELKAINLRYPLLTKMLVAYHFEKKDIESYVALVDKVGVSTFHA